MTQMIITVVACKNKTEAVCIGEHLLKKKLAGCVKITSPVHSMYLWPPKSEIIEEADEVLLVCKTLESKWEEIEKGILSLHSYDTPEIYAIPISRVSPKYLNWLTSELL